MLFCLYSHHSEKVNVVSHLAAVPFIIVVGWLTGCREAHSCLQKQYSTIIHSIKLRDLDVRSEGTHNKIRSVGENCEKAGDIKYNDGNDDAVENSRKEVTMEWG